MMKKLIIMCLLFVLAHFASAQTCVYFCRNTGALGYSVGNDRTCTNAYNLCISAGGTYPQVILSTGKLGYGALAVGYDNYGNRVVGVSAGFTNAYDAKIAAINSCANSGGYNVYIHDTWYDY